MPGPTLIVGSMVVREKEDRRARYPDCVGIDMRPGPGVDVVMNFEADLPTDFLEHFAHVECMSVLEHTPHPWIMANNIIRAMAPGASLFVSVPFVWRVHGYPDDFWRLTANGVRALFLPAIRWSAVRYCAESVIEDQSKLPVAKLGSAGFPYLPRCDVAAFGHRFDA